MGVKKPDKRSPLKQRALRSPGQSLSEERERVLDDQLLPPFIGAAFLVTYAVAEWWRSFTGDPPRPVLFTALAALAVCFVVYRFFKVRSRLQALKLGLEGEKVVGQFLEANREAGWHVFHDIPGDGFNIDHVLVTPRGIFAVETKTFSKPANGDAAVTFDGEKVLVNGHAPDRDPVAQARAARDWIGGLLLKTTDMRFPVRGVVVFPGWWVNSPKGGKRPDIWVLNEKAFVKYILNEPELINSADVALAAARLENYITH